jgi:predicted transcriptional regulator
MCYSVYILQEGCVSAVVRTRIIPKIGNNGLTLLEQWRIESGLTAAGLAREAGISRSVLWRLESRVEDFSPRADTVAKILSILNKKRRELNGEPLEFSSLFETVGSR